MDVEYALKRRERTLYGFGAMKIKLKSRILTYFCKSLVLIISLFLPTNVMPKLKADLSYNSNRRIQTYNINN
ncbi:hypothetical protein Anas_07281 [Armadillidium nasatum]|uniref:Uncharacterized protein n=1 Tax=Armadillidium nasatum TaxID=96803 RepID=A0A5N5SQ07_9CRUS|nr:hypothetical protein Anas_07281 [Armadillidium nasatum]